MPIQSTNTPALMYSPEMHIAMASSQSTATSSLISYLELNKSLVPNPPPFVPLPRAIFELNHIASKTCGCEPLSTNFPSNDGSYSDRFAYNRTDKMCGDCDNCRERLGKSDSTPPVGYEDFPNPPPGQSAAESAAETNTAASLAAALHETTTPTISLLLHVAANLPMYWMTFVNGEFELVSGKSDSETTSWNLITHINDLGKELQPNGSELLDMFTNELRHKDYDSGCILCTNYQSKVGSMEHELPVVVDLTKDTKNSYVQISARGSSVVTLQFKLTQSKSDLATNCYLPNANPSVEEQKITKITATITIAVDDKSAVTTTTTTTTLTSETIEVSSSFVPKGKGAQWSHVEQPIPTFLGVAPDVTFSESIRGWRANIPCKPIVTTPNFYASSIQTGLFDSSYWNYRRFTLGESLGRVDLETTLKESDASVLKENVLVKIADGTWRPGLPSVDTARPSGIKIRELFMDYVQNNLAVLKGEQNPHGIVDAALYCLECFEYEYKDARVCSDVTALEVTNAVRNAEASTMVGGPGVSINVILSYVTRLISSLVHEEHSLFVEVEGHNLYSLKTSTALTKSFTSIIPLAATPPEIVHQIKSRDYPNKFSDETQKMVKETVGDICSINGTTSGFVVKMFIKGVGDNRPLVSPLDPIVIRLTSEYGGQEYVQEIAGIVQSVILKEEAVMVRLPGVEVGHGFANGIKFGVSLSDMPYFNFMLNMAGVKLCADERGRYRYYKSITDGSTGIEVLGNYSKIKEDYDDMLFDVRIGVGVGKGTRLCRRMLIESLPAALRSDIMAKRCGGGVQKYGNFVCIGDRGGVVDYIPTSLDEFERPDEAVELEKVRRLARCIAPSPSNTTAKRLPRPEVADPPEMFNTQLNELQCQAVADVASGFAGSAPYVIWGPPGTGKTTTVVEAVLHVVRNSDINRVLVCAPSDAAADVLALRLTEYFTPNSMKRINHHQRKFESLPAKLMRYSEINKEQVFVVPENFLDTESLEWNADGNFSDLRVVVCTLYVSGMLSGSKTSVGDFFTHCFVDESAQATEPELLLPLLQLRSNAVVCLAGDPKQLGPQICSQKATEQGLGLSLLERLLSLEMYRNGEYGVVTMLENNYRSHKALLEITSALFYESKLRCCAEVGRQQFATNWERLKNKDLPVLFIDCPEGRHIADVDSPSFMNFAEVDAVVEACVSILKDPDVKGVSAYDIGVITPFRAQVLKIRAALRNKGMGGVNVGQVEDFQGQEVRIAVISTVLTHRVEKFQGKEEGTKPFGFMEDGKRFNVALSRAESLCVIVGHRRYLEASKSYWTALIEYCDSKDLMDASAGMGKFVEAVRVLGLGGGTVEDRLAEEMNGWAGVASYAWKVQL
jgi:hypothetical protein